MDAESENTLLTIYRKTALLEGLEIDQYFWGILHNVANTEFEEVTVDATASWKPVLLKPTNNTQVKEEESGIYALGCC